MARRPRISPVPAQDTEAAFAAFDKDGDGSLNFDEFCELVRAREGKTTYSALRKRFDALDADGSGLVSAKEFGGGRLITM